MTVLIILGEYLDAQINGGQSVVEKIVTKLKDLSAAEVLKLLQAVEEDLDTNFIGNNSRVVALDEIGAAMKTLPNHNLTEGILGRAPNPSGYARSKWNCLGSWWYFVHPRHCHHCWAGCHYEGVGLLNILPPGKTRTLYSGWFFTPTCFRVKGILIDGVRL